MRRLLRTLVVPAAILAALPATARCDVLDRGSFKLYLQDRALGAETFEIQDSRDSLVIRARQYLMLPGPRGDESFEKGADILLSRGEHEIRHYQSTRTFRGATVVRALVMADTHYVAYREGEGLGAGEVRALPPGRLYLMDSQVITLFDFICRSLRLGPSETRPIHLLALGPRDTLLEAQVTSLGDATIRWGVRPVVARKLHIIADSRTTFTAWVDTQGRLLRLTEPVSGLRVERDAPRVRRRPAPPPKPGG